MSVDPFAARIRATDVPSCIEHGAIDPLRSGA
jgi:hypothetical protein